MPQWTAGQKTFNYTVWANETPAFNSWTIFPTRFFEVQALYGSPPYPAMLPYYVNASSPFPASPPPGSASNTNEWSTPTEFFTLDSTNVEATGNTRLYLGFTLQYEYDVTVVVGYPASYFPFWLFFTGFPSFTTVLNVERWRYPGELFNVYLHQYAGVGVIDGVMRDFVESAAVVTGTSSVSRQGITLSGSNTTTPSDATVTHWAWAGFSGYKGPYGIGTIGGIHQTTEAFRNYPFDYFNFDQSFEHRPLPEYAMTLEVEALAWDEYGRIYENQNAGTITIPASHAAGIVDAHGDLYSAAIKWDNSSNPKFPIRCATALKTSTIQTVSDFILPPIELEEGEEPYYEPQLWNDDISQFYGDTPSTLLLDSAGNLWLLWKWLGFWYAARSLDSGKFGVNLDVDFGLGHYDIWQFGTTFPYYFYTHTALCDLPLEAGLCAIGTEGNVLRATVSSYSHDWTDTKSAPVDIATLSWGDERDDYGAPMRAFSLLTQSEEKGSWLYATDGCDFLFESRDFGDSWTALTLGAAWERPFNPDEYGAIRFCALDNGAYGAVSIQYATGNVYFTRTYNGFMGWTAPVFVMALNDAFPVANICQLKRLNSSILCVWNGGDVNDGKIALSLNGGDSFTLN